MTSEEYFERFRERLDTHDIALDAISKRLEEMDQQLDNWETK